MTRVIAALDASMTARPVLLATQALGRLLSADVEAVHVVVDGDRVPRETAAAEHVPLRVVQPPVVDALVQVAAEADVGVIALGTRRSPLGHEPLGSTALAVATSVTTPVLVVPPDTRRPGQLQRVLLPLEGRGVHVPREMITLAEGSALDLFALQVLEEESLPLFTDQPQHEYPARVRELLQRYCPWGIDTVHCDMRVGRYEELVPAFAEQMEVDIIALGWAGDLARDREPIVRAALDRAHVPVFLIPVESTEAERVAIGGDSWSSSRSS